MTRPFALSAVALLAATALQASAPAQSVTYEKYQLDNGMTVILHEDHTLPEVVVNIWYRVGSKDEAPGRSGFAHLFEHLMFMGTERVPGSAFDDIMEAGGGRNNASTSNDRTNYYDLGPAEILPTLLWLEADRLEDLGRTMTQEKLDLQRDVVRNERRQNVENQPYGKARSKSPQLLFPPGHPYHHTVIGSHADLEAGTLQDVQNFFATYYVPNNASLVIAGDFDAGQVKELVQKLFGSLPRGADAVRRVAGPFDYASQTFTTTDNVQFARTGFTWHSPGFFAEGDAEMDLIGAILSDGVSSRLYRRLVVEDKLAVDVAAYQQSRQLGSNFTIEAYARAGMESDLERIEAAIDEVVEQFKREGPTREEVQRQVAQLEHGTLDGLQSVRAKADRMNMYEFYFGEPNSFERDLDRYRSATPEGVRDWARQVLRSDARLVMRVLPEAPAPETNPRDERPQALARGEFTPPAPTTFTLSNGITVHHWQRGELPLVELALLLPFGAASDARERSGLASLTAGMLDEGAGQRDAVQFADALDTLGASFGARVEQESTTISLSTLKRTFGDALDLFADALLRPRFDETEWQRVHDLHLQGIRQALDSPTQVAQRVGAKTFFGPEHPYGRPARGTLESASAVSLDDVRSYHRGAYVPVGAQLICAGDLGTGELRSALEKALGSWRGKAGGAGAPVAASFGKPANEKLRVVFVDRPGAVQTVVRFMLPARSYKDPQRPARLLLTTVLGGTFTSRLNRNLREEKGYTYGANAGLRLGPSVGYFVASSSVRTDVTGPAIAEFLKEFRALRAGDVSAEEAEKAGATRRVGLVQDFGSLGGVVRTMAGLIQNGLSFDSVGQDLAAYARLGAQEINAIAAETLPLDRALLVLVGDKEAVLPQLESLDLPPVEQLTVTGEPLEK